MDPFHVCFKDAALESQYLNFRTQQLRRHDLSEAWTAVRLVRVTVMLLSMSANKAPVQGTTVAFLGLFVALPVLQQGFQRSVSEEWFVKHGFVQRWIHGLVQILMCAILTNKQILATLEHGGSFQDIDIIVASGLFTQCFNLFWFHSRFYFFLTASICSCVLWHCMVLGPYCQIVLTSSDTNVSSSAFSMLGALFDNTFMMVNSKPNDVSVSQSCSQVLSWWHIYVGVVCMAYLALRVERHSRASFMASTTSQPSSQYHVKSLGSTELVPLALMLPLSWQLVGLSHSLRL